MSEEEEGEFQKRRSRGKGNCRMCSHWHRGHPYRVQQDCLEYGHESKALIGVTKEVASCACFSSEGCAKLSNSSLVLPSPPSLWSVRGGAHPHWSGDHTLRVLVSELTHGPRLHDRNHSTSTMTSPKQSNLGGEAGVLTRVRAKGHCRHQRGVGTTNGSQRGRRRHGRQSCRRHVPEV